MYTGTNKLLDFYIQNFVREFNLIYLHKQCTTVKKLQIDFFTIGEMGVLLFYALVLNNELQFH